MNQPVTTSHVAGRVLDGFLLALIVGFAIWLFIRTLKRSEDPARLLFKWILTIPAIIGFIILGHFLQKALGNGVNYGSAFVSAVGTASLAVYLAAVWRHNLCSFIANPFANLYTGGETPPEPKPFYSLALAKRKRGRYDEALAEIRKELDKFPADFEGQMLLADIQAENLNDLPGASITVQRICNQPNHAPRSIAMALNCLADWCLKFHQDRDSAREALEKIIALFPDSEMSALASQRIGRLASAEHLLAPHDRKKFAVVKGIQNLGLLDPKLHPKPADPHAAEQAEELVKHLHSHPLDTEAREKLALIYANHYNRLDLAANELEQLITSPNQPPKRVIHWLNVLADLQIRLGTDYDTVRATVQRIIDLFPNAASAQVAASRIAHLKLELKAKEKSQAVKLGSYEQDIGLKSGLPY